MQNNQAPDKYFQCQACNFCYQMKKYDAYLHQQKECYFKYCFPCLRRAYIDAIEQTKNKNKKIQLKCGCELDGQMIKQLQALFRTYCFVCGLSHSKMYRVQKDSKICLDCWSLYQKYFQAETTKQKQQFDNKFISKNRLSEQLFEHILSLLIKCDKCLIRKAIPFEPTQNNEHQLKQRRQNICEMCIKPQKNQKNVNFNNILMNKAQKHNCCRKCGQQQLQGQYPLGLFLQNGRHYYCWFCLYSTYKENKLFRNSIIRLQACGCTLQKNKLNALLSDHCFICGDRDTAEQNKIGLISRLVYQPRFYCSTCEIQLSLQNQNIKNIELIKNLVKINQQAILQKQYKPQIPSNQKKHQIKTNQNKKQYQRQIKTIKQEKQSPIKAKQISPQDQKQRIKLKKFQEITSKQIAQTHHKCYVCKRKELKIKVNTRYSGCFSLHADQRDHYFCSPCLFSIYHQQKHNRFKKKIQTNTNKVLGSSPSYRMQIWITYPCKCQISQTALNKFLEQMCVVCGLPSQEKNQVNFMQDRYYCNVCQYRKNTHDIAFANLKSISESISKVVQSQDQNQIKMQPLQRPSQQEGQLQKVSEQQNNLKNVKNVSSKVLQKDKFQDPICEQQQFSSNKNQSTKNNKTQQNFESVMLVQEQVDLLKSNQNNSHSYQIKEQEPQQNKLQRQFKNPVINQHLRDLQQFLKQPYFDKQIHKRYETQPIYINPQLIPWNQEDPDYSQDLKLKLKLVIFQKINAVKYRCKKCQETTEYLAFDNFCKHCFLNLLFEETNLKLQIKQKSMQINEQERLKDRNDMNIAKIRSIN